MAAKQQVETAGNKGAKSRARVTGPAVHSPLPLATNQLVMGLPGHRTAGPLRQAAVQVMQQQYGNRYVQRVLGRQGQAAAVQRCGGEVHAGCACADEQREEEREERGERTAAPAVQRQSQPAADALELAPDSPYRSIPAPLLETIRRSFRERDGSNHNLDNAFWGGTPPNLDTALDRYGASGVNAMVEIYQRANAIGGIWPYVGSIRNVWGGSSRGFLFNCTNLSGLEGEIGGKAGLCRDSFLGGSQHRPKRCHREVVAGGHGLHVCVHESSPCEIHLDLHQVVEGRDSDGGCNYAEWELPRHWGQVFGGQLPPAIFERIDGLWGEINRLRSDVTRQRGMNPGVREQLLQDNDRMLARRNAMMPRARQLAVRGHEGEVAAEQDSEIQAALQAIEGTMASNRQTMLNELPEMPSPRPGRAGGDF